MSYQPGPMPELGDACRAILHRQGVPSPPLMDTAERFYQLITRSCPFATVRASVEHYGGGSVARTTLCHATIVAPNIQGVIELRGATPELAIAPLRKKWAQARREHEAHALISQCTRLASGHLTDEQKDEMFERLTAAPWEQYETLASSYRSAAAQMGRDNLADTTYYLGK